MPAPELHVVETRGDPVGSVGIPGEEDVLGQFAWTESDVILPFAIRERDAVVRVRQVLPRDSCSVTVAELRRG
jgi:hypothetical protein